MQFSIHFTNYSPVRPSIHPSIYPSIHHHLSILSPFYHSSIQSFINIHPPLIFSSPSFFLSLLPSIPGRFCNKVGAGTHNRINSETWRGKFFSVVELPKKFHFPTLKKLMTFFCFSLNIWFITHYLLDISYSILHFPLHSLLICVKKVFYSHFKRGACHEIKSPPKQIISLAEMKSPTGDSVSEQRLPHRNRISPSTLLLKDILLSYITTTRILRYISSFDFHSCLNVDI